jgi:hypothetical protein
VIHVFNTGAMQFGQTVRADTLRGNSARIVHGENLSNSSNVLEIVSTAETCVCPNGEFTRIVWVPNEMRCVPTVGCQICKSYLWSCVAASGFFPRMRST